MTQLLLRSIPQTKQRSSCDKLQTSRRGLFKSDPEAESENKNKMCLLVLGTIRIFAPSPLMQNTLSRIMFPDQVRLPPTPPLLLLPPDENQGRKQDVHQYKPMVYYLHYQFCEKSKYFKVVVFGQNICYSQKLLKEKLKCLQAFRQY